MFDLTRCELCDGIVHKLSYQRKVNGEKRYVALDRYWCVDCDAAVRGVTVERRPGR